MLDTLLESGPHAVRRGHGAAASVIVHSALIAGAVIATAQAGIHAPDTTRPPDLVYVAPPAPAPATSQRTTQRGGRSDYVLPDVLIPRVPVPDLSAIGIDRTDVLDRMTLFGRDSIGTNTAAHGAPGSGVYSSDVVERLVYPFASNGRPQYPTVLRAANVEGDAVLRFVVDSAGHVEPGSVAVVAATHRLFADAAVRWILTTRYVPAQLGGKSVRQLVEQRVGFTLQR